LGSGLFNKVKLDFSTKRANLICDDLCFSKIKSYAGCSNRDASNQKAKTWLGWNPGTNEEAILATNESLVHFNLK
jgi:hypothetical protein